MTKHAYGVILIAEHPFRRNKGRMGKVVKSVEDGEVVLRFHNAATMRSTGTLGVHPESLDYLMKVGGARIEFRLDDGQWLWTTPEEILAFGFLHTFSPGRPPLFNLPLERWRRMDPPSFVYVPDAVAFIVKLAPVDPQEMLRGRQRPRRGGERIRKDEAVEQSSLL